MRAGQLSAEYDRLVTEIANVGDLVDDGRVQGFVRSRTEAVEELRKLRAGITNMEHRVHVAELEVAELNSFLKYLVDLSDKLPRAQSAADIIGNIDFTHCPAMPSTALR
jgi:hypothetical protein